MRACVHIAIDAKLWLFSNCVLIHVTTFRNKRAILYKLQQFSNTRASIYLPPAALPPPRALNVIFIGLFSIAELSLFQCSWTECKSSLHSVALAALGLEVEQAVQCNRISARAAKFKAKMYKWKFFKNILQLHFNIAYILYTHTHYIIAFKIHIQINIVAKLLVNCKLCKVGKFYAVTQLILHYYNM